MNRPCSSCDLGLFYLHVFLLLEKFGSCKLVSQYIQRCGSSYRTDFIILRKSFAKQDKILQNVLAPYIWKHVTNKSALMHSFSSFDERKNKHVYLLGKHKSKLFIKMSGGECIHQINGTTNHTKTFQIHIFLHYYCRH